jgi:RNA ligase
MKGKTRSLFREAVFARDRHHCVMCGAEAQDAHHILERRLFTDGGYHPDNGASLCGECHLAAERTRISPEQIREAAGIAKPFLPAHLYSDQRYDKWGNIVISGERRLAGELFHDESVRKALREGGVLDAFVSWVKYPRTHHLPSSPGMHPDDRIIPDMGQLESAADVVVSLKMDGENTTLYRDHIHARSVESSDHVSRHWVKNQWSRIAHDIPTGWRVCGENLWAVHSIRYDNLLSYFLVFSVWTDCNECLAWDDTLEWAELLGLRTVPVIYRGPFDAAAIQLAFDQRCDLEHDEGYVVRTAGSFAYGAFRKCVAKWVRPGHLQTTKHWFRGQRVERNAMEGDERG